MEKNQEQKLGQRCYPKKGGYKNTDYQNDRNSSAPSPPQWHLNETHAADLGGEGRDLRGEVGGAALEALPEDELREAARTLLGYPCVRVCLGLDPPPQPPLSPFFMESDGTERFVTRNPWGGK